MPNSSENLEKVLAEWLAATVLEIKKNPDVNVKKTNEKLVNIEAKIEKIEYTIDKLALFVNSIQRSQHYLTPEVGSEIAMPPERKMSSRNRRYSRTFGKESRIYRMRRTGINADVPFGLMEALQVSPYLHKAILEAKPFNINESLRLLINDE